MEKYKVSFTFNNYDSLNDIFIKVLLKELKMILKNKDNIVSSFCTDLSLNNKGGMNNIFREHE